MKITLRELMSDFENVTYPVTLVCAGNRRKEQNVVRKSKGFSWGPSGVSTALFTGVVMADIIKKAKPTRKARYVCMEGADKLVRSDPRVCRVLKIISFESLYLQTAALLDFPGAA